MFEQIEQLYVRALNDVQAQLPEFVPREINLCSKTVEINARRVVEKKTPTFYSSVTEYAYRRKDVAVPRFNYVTGGGSGDATTTRPTRVR